MTRPPSASWLERIPRSFWRRVSSATGRLLMLDYDGTLAPFRVDRRHALPPPRSLEALKASTRDPGTTLAIVSGRPIAELDRLLGQLDAVFVGEHGWEVRRPGARLVRHAPPAEADWVLRRGAVRIEEEGGAHVLERKRTSLMVHTRGLPGAEARAWCERARDLWARDIAEPELPVRIVPVNGGIELRAVGRDKGTAVRDLMESAAEGTLAVYLGDDQTDEDAFREIATRGIPIRVGGRAGPTVARHELASWQEVGRFLRRWVTAISGAPGPWRASR